MSEPGIGANPIYSTEARPAFSQLSFTQPAADTAAVIFSKPSIASIMHADGSILYIETYACLFLSCQHYSMKWTAAGETATGDGGSRLRGSKRLKTKTPATAQGPQHHGQRCSPKPTTSQSIKVIKAVCVYLLILDTCLPGHGHQHHLNVLDSECFFLIFLFCYCFVQAPPCKRSQKLGDKITALQQLVSPYGKVSSWTCRSCPVSLLVTWHVACADGYGISAPRGSHLHQAPPRADPGEQMAHRPLTYSE